MTPDEVRSVRNSLGMSINEFAAALGVQPQTARRWEMPETARQFRPVSMRTKALIESLLKR